MLYIYIKKAELFTNIYFKTTLQFFFFASYHDCLEIWGNNFNNNLQCISTLHKKAIRIVNKISLKLSIIFVF